jgi:hypothetical protein
MNPNNKQCPVVNYFGPVFGELIGLAVAVGSVYYFFPALPFITPSYSQWLPTAISTAVINAVIKSVGHLINKKRIKILGETITIILSAYSLLVLSRIFPFDFSDTNFSNFNNYIKYAFNGIFVVLAIAVIVNVTKIITGFPKEE